MQDRSSTCQPSSCNPEKKTTPEHLSESLIPLKETKICQTDALVMPIEVIDQSWLSRGWLPWMGMAFLALVCAFSLDPKTLRLQSGTGLVLLLVGYSLGLMGVWLLLKRQIQQKDHVIDLLIQQCQEASRQVARCSQEEDTQIHQTLTVQDLYNNAPCGYHSIGVDGTVLLINDTELEMLGYSREEVIGKMLFLDFVAPESQQKWLEKFQQLKTKGVVKEVEILLRNRSGELFPVLANSTAVTDAKGNYLMSRSTLVDVRKRKAIELALQKSEAQYRGIVEDQTDLICRFLPDGRLTFVNQAYCVYFGLTSEALIGKPFIPLIPEDDRAAVSEQFLSLSVDCPVVQYEHRVILSNGEVRWQAWSDRAIFDEAGQVVEYQGVGRDISDRKLQEAAVVKLSKALEIAVVGMVEVNPQGRVTNVNQAYAEMNGYDETELIGDEWWHLIVPEDRPLALRAYQSMMKTDRAEVEVCAMRKDGTTFDRKIVLVKAYGEQQQFVGHYCFTQDISSQREVDRLKDEFVSIVSHELRTPLTSIAGALDLVSSGILQARPEQAHRMVTIAAQNTERLVRMINDILDMERIKSGKITMERQVCDLSIILQESVDVMQMLADSALVKLKLDTPTVMVSVDRDRMIQVLTNLLSNAIKFSEPHTDIEIEATVLSPESSRHPVVFQLDQSAVLVAIRDRGRGIPHDKLVTIFEPFKQVDASDSRQKGGTGLGLAICRSILQQHNAPLWVESTLGQGSTFYFALTTLLKSSTTPI